MKTSFIPISNKLCKFWVAVPSQQFDRIGGHPHNRVLLKFDGFWAVAEFGQKMLERQEY